MAVGESKLTKEQIASRMFRNAAKIWGYNDTELDNFDPVVKLLIEACSVELFNLNNEISNVQQRILEKLANILTPDIYTFSRPAHGIVHLSVSDPTGVVTPFYQFYSKKKIPSKSSSQPEITQEIYFSPSSNFRLINASVKYQICGGNVYRVTPQQTKEIEVHTDEHLQNHTLWLGVEFDSRVEEIDGLSFYIDLRNHPDKQSLIQLFSYSNISIDGKQIKLGNGLNPLPSLHSENQSALLAGNSYNPLDEFRISANIEKSVHQFYDSNFVFIESIEDNTPFEQINTHLYPEILENHYSPEQLKGFKDKIHWFKFTFSPSFDSSVLDELTISINCVPVLNRKLCETRYRLQSFINIIPLIAEDTFLDISSVRNIAGKAYYENPIEQNILDTKGSYSVRSSGVERFDHRSAQELLSYTTELLRDESGAFAAYGQDFIASAIRDINEGIGLIRKKIEQNNIDLKQRSTFLFVKPYEEGDNIYAEFWTTAGASGNGIRSGTKLDVYNGSDINPKKGVYLITTSAGGADRLKGSQLLYAYKNALLSRDRIVSVQDIVNTCQQVWGVKSKGAEVKRGVMVSAIPEEGLVSTTDIFVKLRKSDIPEEEIEALKHELFVKLKYSSDMNARYRIFTN